MSDCRVGQMDGGRGSQLLSIGHKLKHLSFTNTLGLMPPSEMKLLGEMSRLTYLEPDKLIKVSDIAQALEISPPAVSRTLNKLEEKQYLERLMDKGDRRNVYITLTAAGKEALKDNLRKVQEFLECALLHLSDDEIEQLTLLFDKVYQGMKMELNKLEQEKENTHIC